MMKESKGGGLLDDEGAGLAAGVGLEAGAHVVNDLVAEVFAAWAPAVCAGELFDDGAEAVEADHVWGLPQASGEFAAQLGEEEQFAVSGGVFHQFGQMGIERRNGAGPGVGEDAQAHCAQGVFERGGKFGHGDELALQLDFEIMEDGGGGVADEFGVNMGGGVAEQFEGDPLCGTRDIVAAVGLED